MQLTSADKPTSNVPWILLVKISILSVVTVFIVRAVLASRDEFAGSDFSVRHIHFGWVAVCSLCYCVGMVPMALNWARLLHAMGQPVPTLSAMKMHFMSQLGKYVPGKAFVMALRLGMLRPYRTEVGPSVLSMAAETLSMMSVGAILGGLAIAIQFRDRPQISLLAAAMAMAAGLPILPPVLRFALRIVRKQKTGRAGDDELANRLTWSVVLPGWLGIFPGWCLLGTSMFAAMKALNLPETQAMTITQLPWIAGTYAISVVAGFLSMLPGGFGVREWVMKELIEPEFGAVVALLAPVLHRMTSLLTELVVSCILYMTSRKS